MSSKEKCTEEPCSEKIRRKLLKLFYHYQYYILLGLFLFFFFPFCSALFRYLLVDSSTKIPSFLTGFNTSVTAKLVFAIICILSFFGSLFLTNRQRVVTKKEYGLKWVKSLLYVALGVIYFFFIRPLYAYDLEVLINFHGVTIYFFDALLIPLISVIRLTLPIVAHCYKCVSTRFKNICTSTKFLYHIFFGSVIVGIIILFPLFLVAILCFYSLVSLPSLLFVLIFSCINKLSAIIFFKVEDKDSEGGFLVESPISTSEDDRYYRTGLAKTLVEKIMHTHNEECSFGIGIVGKWGTGKTSFMNLMSNEIKDKAILVNFRPWVYDNKNSLTYAFFMGLSKALKPYDKSLARDIKFYQSLLNAVDTNFTRLCSALLSRNNNFDAQHQKISQAIKKIGKPIIVMIDDLDRLDEQEIVEVLKLIRNTASFPRTFYVAGYDREYINAAIKNINECDSDKYLEKIFQYELNFPEYEKSWFNNWFLDKLHPILSKKDMEIIRKNFNPTSLSIQLGLFPRLRALNIREILRLINAFSFVYKCLEKTIYPLDLLTIEFLKLKHLKEFILFSESRDKYLCVVDSSFAGKLVLYNGQKSSNALRPFYKLSEDKRFSEDFRYLLECLFNSSDRELGINTPRCCSRYFRYSFQNDDINDDEFKTAWSGGIQTLKPYIMSFHQSSFQSLADKLFEMYKYNRLSNEKSYVLFLDIIFVVYYKFTEETNRLWVESFFYEVLTNFLKTYEKDSEDNFKKIYSKNLNSVLLYKMLCGDHDIILKILNLLGDSFIVKIKKEIITFLKRRKSQDKIIFFMSYLGNQMSNPYKDGNKDLILELTQYIESNLNESNLDSLLNYLVYPQILGCNEKFCLNKVLVYCLGIEQGFQAFIDKISKNYRTNTLIEFIDFYNKSHGGSDSPVKFNFKYLQPYLY